MFGFGMQELIIIFIIVVILFGASRLPELGKGMGSFIKNFRKATSETEKIDTGTEKTVNNEVNH